jgi:hypothetical protein
MSDSVFAVLITKRKRKVKEETKKRSKIVLNVEGKRTRALK